MKPVVALSAWSSPTDIDKKESGGWNPPQGVAPHAHRDVVGAHEGIAANLYENSAPSSTALILDTFFLAARARASEIAPVELVQIL